MDKSKKIAIVTGANRGIGFGVAKALAQKGYKILMLGRTLSEIQTAADQIRDMDFETEAYEVDVSRGEQIRDFGKTLQGKYGRADILVNNAGIFIDVSRKSPDEDPSSLLASPETLLRTFETNTLGAFQMCQVVIPLMKKNNWGRVVNISSGMGGLTEMNGYCPGYRLSKVALNAVTRIFSEELLGTGIKVNSVCPGWVKTEMGGPNATRSIEDGVQGILWAATLPEDGPTGGFFRDGVRLAW